MSRHGVSPNVRCPVLIANARMLISAEMIRTHHTIHELTLMQDYCVYAVNGNMCLTLFVKSLSFWVYLHMIFVLMLKEIAC